MDEINQMKYGKVLTNGTILGLKSFEDNQYYKIERKELASQVLDEDIVEFELINQKAVVYKIISRSSQPFIGVVTKITPKYIYLNLPLLNPFSSIPHPSLMNRKIEIGTKVLGEISLDKLQIQSLYKNDRQLLTDYYIHLHQKNLSLNPIQLEKDLSTQTVKDLTYLTTFHIDPSGCVDIDDFMSIDSSSNKIYIHIVDITKYIPLNSKEDLEERKIGYTWYFPDFSIHLHAPESSKQLFCLTLEIQIDPSTNQPERIDFYPSKIKCSYDFIYEEIQDIFDEKVVHSLKNDLIWSLNIIQRIYFPKQSHFRKRIIQKQNDKIDLRYQEELLSHRFVSAWMIYYNSWIAEHFPVPQRFHPETKILEMNHSQLPKEVQHILYVKQMREADYRNHEMEKQEDKILHFALNKKFYTHSTSPLRRYFDRLIQNICVNNIKDVSNEVLDHLNRMERLSERVNEWYEKQLLFTFVEQNKDKLWQSFIVQKHFNGIELYIYDLQEFIFVKNLFQDKNIGDQINIRNGIPNFICDSI